MESKVSRRDALGTVALGTALAAGMGFMRPAMAEFADTMITQTASFGLNPEKKEEAKEAILRLVKAVEEKEPGVLAYIPHFTEKDQVFFFEVYKDAETLQAHGKQPHMAEIKGAFASGALKMPLEVVKMSRIAGFYRV
ncbi:MAG: antibiotic biosynthesis monooxygenase [Candidatus Hydrogenedentes bacterium]|nr:antibiotic biosynthesis monooxygenase [Candidatus Hydrogenedentota bacterium]